MIQRANQAKKGNIVRAKIAQKGDEGENKNDDPVDSEAGDAGAAEQEASTNGRISVDDFMGGGFVKGMGKGSDDGGDSEEEDGEGEDDDASLQDIDDLSDDEGEEHAQDLARLAKKDPDFFKYLQENDQELLDFGNDEEDEEDIEIASEAPSDKKKGKKKATEKKVEVVTSELLKGWQKSILKVRFV